MNDSERGGSLETVRAEALVKHYQKTYELVLRFWERRNMQFLILVGVLAVAAIATILQVPLIDAFKRYLTGILQIPKPDISTTSTTEKDVVLDAVPLAYRVVVIFLLVAIFYLMANLYHRSGLIINYYQYLALLERRIRDELGFGPTDVAFAREGRFYTITGSRMTRWIGFSYKLILGSVTLLFLASRIWFDRPSNWPQGVAGPEDVIKWYGWLVGNLFFVIDVVVAVPTLWLFWKYVSLRALREDRVLDRFQR